MLLLIEGVAYRGVAYRGVKCMIPPVESYVVAYTEVDVL